MTPNTNLYHQNQHQVLTMQVVIQGIKRRHYICDELELIQLLLY